MKYLTPFFYICLGLAFIAPQELNNIQDLGKVLAASPIKISLALLLMLHGFLSFFDNLLSDKN